LSTTDRDGQGTIAKAALCRNSDWPAKTSQQSSCRAKFGTAWSSRSFYRLYIACTSRHDRLAVIHVIHFFCLTASSGRGHSFLYHQGLRHQGCCQTRPLPLFVFVQLSEENGLLGSNTLFITCHDGPRLCEGYGQAEALQSIHLQNQTYKLFGIHIVPRVLS